MFFWTLPTRSATLWDSDWWSSSRVGLPRNEWLEEKSPTGQQHQTEGGWVSNCWFWNVTHVVVLCFNWNVKLLCPPWENGSARCQANARTVGGLQHVAPHQQGYQILLWEWIRAEKDRGYVLPRVTCLHLGSLRNHEVRIKFSLYCIQNPLMVNPRYSILSKLKLEKPRYSN